MKLLIALLTSFVLLSCHTADQKNPKITPLSQSDSLPISTSIELVPPPPPNFEKSPLKLPKITKGSITKDTFDKKKLIQLVNTFITSISKDSSSKKIYLEDIPLFFFGEKKVAWGELEIRKYKNWTLIHADYFADNPIESKRFLARNDSLVYTEIMELKEVTTENGTTIKETIGQQFYYYKNKLISTIDLTAKADKRAIDWNQENLNDWKIIKNHQNHE